MTAVNSPTVPTSSSDAATRCATRKVASQCEDPAGRVSVGFGKNRDLILNVDQHIFGNETAETAALRAAAPYLLTTCLMLFAPAVRFEVHVARGDRERVKNRRR